jgi:hypothetical protein
MHDAIDHQDAIELLLLNHQQIHENIKFADQKASALIAANGALLALTYSLIDQKVPFSLSIGFPLCLLLAVAIGLSFWVVKPRGERNRKRGPGVVDSIRICLYSLEAYKARLSDISTDELLDELRTFIHDRAWIDARKYLFLRRSLIASAIGWITALMFAAWSKFQITLNICSL